MASATWRFDLTWENGVSFQMAERLDAGDAVTIIQLDENAAIKSIWNHVESICLTAFNGKLTAIGEDMKA